MVYIQKEHLGVVAIFVVILVSDLQIANGREIGKVIVRAIRFTVSPPELHADAAAKVYDDNTTHDFGPRHATPNLTELKDPNALLDEYYLRVKQEPSMKSNTNSEFQKNVNDKNSKSDKDGQPPEKDKRTGKEQTEGNTIQSTQATKDPNTNKLKIDAEPPLSSKIIGGSHSSPNAWPWQASIQYYGSDHNWHHFCGGSLVHYQWVVTAAHCLSQLEDYVVRVVLGEDQLSYFTYREQIINPARMLMHGFYNESSIYFDIAMIQLVTHAEPTPYVSTVEVATFKIDSFSSNDICYIAGWGNVIGKTEQHYTSDFLQQSRMLMITRSECRHAYGNIIVDSQVCVISDTASACTGDSGGPLVCASGNVWYLTGVASLVGRSDCAPSYPNVYTRMSTFSSWMESVIRQFAI